MALHGKIIFRTDGGEKIGLNHLIRCAALAEMLREQYECVLAIRVPNPSALQLVGGVFHSIIPLPASENYDGDELISILHAGDIVVLDGIQFQTEYQKKSASIVELFALMIYTTIILWRMQSLITLKEFYRKIFLLMSIRAFISVPDMQ